MQICIQISWKLAEILVFLFEEGAAILDLTAILDLAILDSAILDFDFKMGWKLELIKVLTWT